MVLSIENLRVLNVAWPSEVKKGNVHCAHKTKAYLLKICEIFYATFFKKNIAICGRMVYNSKCCDVDSVEA